MVDPMKSTSRKPSTSAAPSNAGQGQHLQIPDRPLSNRHSRAELAHELEVHQFELEMQNEELRHAQLDLAATRDRFIDLYDFAPVGYCTLDARGIVTDANLTAATLLATDRWDMLKHGFSRFVAPAQSELWNRHLRRTLQSQEAQRIELDLVRRGGGAFHAQLDCLAVDATTETSTVRITVTDVTARAAAEMDRRIAVDALDAREAERRHMARALHEELGQRLSAIKMELSRLCRGVDPDSHEQRVNDVLGSLDEALASVRRMTIDLRPPMLDDLGLSAAIEWLVHDAVRRMGVNVTLQLQEVTPAPDARLAIATYRMAQDMLHHVARQATGSATTLSLAREQRKLVLALRMHSNADRCGNNNADFEALVHSLKDRAHLISGKLFIGLTVDGKLSITVRVPLGSDAITGTHTASGPKWRATRSVASRSTKERAR
jgi:two-component system sensor histidine kinase UhpB